MLNEIQELQMIERQMKINDIISDYSFTNKELSSKFFPKLFNLISECIDNGITMDKYIENIKSPSNIRWRFTDEEGNQYEVEGIHSQRLANLWTKFDYKYKGSYKMGYYLNSLITYIRTRTGYTNFNITLLNNK